VKENRRPRWGSRVGTPTAGVAGAAGQAPLRRERRDRRQKQRRGKKSKSALPKSVSVRNFRRWSESENRGTNGNGRAQQASAPTRRRSSASGLRSALRPG